MLIKRNNDINIAKNYLFEAIFQLQSLSKPLSPFLNYEQQQKMIQIAIYAIENILRKHDELHKYLNTNYVDENGNIVYDLDMIKSKYLFQIIHNVGGITVEEHDSDYILY